MDGLDRPEPGLDVLARAEAAADAFIDSREAAARLAAFYTPASDYAGLTFHELPPATPSWPRADDLTAADLLAITLMEVQASPHAVRSMLETGEVRDRILAALARVPTDVTLADAGPADLEAAAELYLALKAGLGGKNRWVAASKLAARKRPALIPVRDSVVVDVLGLPNTNVREDWLVFRHLVNDHGRMKRLRELSAKAAAEHGAPDLSDVPDLRLLDTVLWMRPDISSSLDG